MEARTITTFVCEHCHADVDSNAAFCGTCGAPTSPAEHGPGSSATNHRLINRPWFIVVLVLHLGIFGIPVYWQMEYPVQTRWLIIFASLLYTLFAVVVIYWSLQQILSLF